MKNQHFNNLEVSGFAKLTNIESGSLEVSGSLSFSDLVVETTAEISGFFDGHHGTFNNLEVSGSFSAYDIVCRNLEVSGPVISSRLKVSEKADISGNLDVKQSEFNDLTYSAQNAFLEDTNANNIFAKKTTPCFIHTNGVHCSMISTYTNSNNNNCGNHINDNHIDSNGCTDTKQKLYLKGNTIISGDITFESGIGEVIIQGSSAKIVGKVIGGTIVEKNL